MHYVKNRDIQLELIKCQETGILSETMIEYLDIIYERVKWSHAFFNLARNDDLQQHVRLTLCKYWKNINTEKNCFSYLTTMIRNAMNEMQRFATRKLCEKPSGLLGDYQND